MIHARPVQSPVNICFVLVDYFKSGDGRTDDVVHTYLWKTCVTIGITTGSDCRAAS